MINYYKNIKRLINFSKFLLENNKTPVNKIVEKMPFLYFVNESSQIRNKTKSQKKRRSQQRHDESSDEEDEDDDYDDDGDNDDEDFVDKDSAAEIVTVKSLRIDNFLRRAFGVPRRKIEEVFYENKIRVNGKVLLKKSYNISEGDEIDLIKKFEDYNENTLRIARVKVLKMKPHSNEDKFIIKVLKSKSMVIQNYDGQDGWSEPLE